MNTDFVIPGKAEELAAQFDANAKSLQTARDAMSVEEAGYAVILVSDLPMKLWTVEGVQHCEWTTLHQATRFAEHHEAARIARTIVNGRGDRGQAWRADQAYDAAIKHLQSMAAELRANAE